MVILDMCEQKCCRLYTHQTRYYVYIAVCLCFYPAGVRFHLCLYQFLPLHTTCTHSEPSQSYAIAFTGLPTGQKKLAISSANMEIYIHKNNVKYKQ